MIYLYAGSDILVSLFISQSTINLNLLKLNEKLLAADQWQILTNCCFTSEEASGNTSLGIKSILLTCYISLKFPPTYGAVN